jgi:hypothetical protein
LNLPANRAIELRTETFNLPHTTPLGAPNGLLGSAVFGAMTTAGDSRVIPFAMKFVF